MKHNYFSILAFIFLLTTQLSLAQSIQSVSPLQTPAGAQLEILGSNLPAADNAEVWFGSAQGTVEQSNGSSMTVLVPAGASYGPIVVRRKSDGYQLYTKEKFLPAFHGPAFDPAKMESAIYFSDITGLFDLATADFDLDGKPDVLATHSNTQIVRIFRNQSSATVFSFSTSSLSTSFGASDAAHGDVDGDGKIDLLLSGYGSYANRIFTLRNTSVSGMIQFADPVTMAVQGSGAAQVRLFDLTGDGKPEAILSNKSTGILTIYTNESSPGTIKFSTTPYTYTISGASHSYGVDFADFDGDGKIDVALSSNQENELFILANTGSGNALSFSDAQLITTDYGLINLRTADFNQDGKGDIVITNVVQSAIYIWENTSSTSSITFNSPLKLSTDANPWGLEIADMNGDEKADIIVGHNQGQSIRVFENSTNSGSLSFTPHSLPLANKSRNLDVVDLNGDGKPDLVFTGTLTNQLGIIRNAHCVTPRVRPEESITLCQGMSATLQGTSAPGATYQWYKDGSLLTETGPNLLITTGGNYYMSIQTPDGCSGNSNTVTVTEVSTDVGSMAFEPVAPVCETEDLHLRVQPINEATYTWLGPDGYTATTSTPEHTRPNVNTSMAGVYQVKVTTPDCEFTITSDPVTINPNPQLTITSSAGNRFCGGSSVFLSVPEGAAAYQWYVNGQAVSQADPLAHQLEVSAPGEYTVDVQQESGCTRMSAAFTLQEVAPPVASFTAPVLGCLNQAVQFSNTSSLAEGETPVFLWTFTDTEGNTTSSSQENPSHTFSGAPGVYTVTLEVGYQGLPCRQIAQKEIEIIETPVINLIADAPGFCSGESVNVQPDAEVVSAVWNDGSTEISRAIDIAGTYTAAFTLESGCVVESSINIIEYALPEVHISADKNMIAPGEAVTLTASGGIFYTWEAEESLASLEGAEVIATPQRSTTYRVWAENENGCLGMGEIHVEVSADFIVQAPKLFVPNVDQNWTVEGSEYYPDVELRILNELGQPVFEQKGYQNNWDGTQDSKLLPAGVYYYFFLDPQGIILKSGSITLIR